MVDKDRDFDERPDPAEDVMDDQLTDRQRIVLAALLAGAGIEAAARRATCGSRSIRRWLAESRPFRSALEAGRRAIRDAMEARVLAAADDALERLRRIVREGLEDGIAVQAARTLLQMVGLTGGPPVGAQAAPVGLYAAAAATIRDRNMPEEAVEGGA